MNTADVTFVPASRISATDDYTSLINCVGGCINNMTLIDLQDSQTYIYQWEFPFPQGLILRIVRNLQRITTTCVVRNCQVQVKRECLCRSQSQSSFSLCVPKPRLYQVFVRLHKTHPCYITTTPNTIFAAECWNPFSC